jgi:hypothetical protein
MCIHSFDFVSEAYLHVIRPAPFSSKCSKTPAVVVRRGGGSATLDVLLQDGGVFMCRNSPEKGAVVAK